MSITLSHRLDNDTTGVMRLRVWVSHYTNGENPAVFAHQRYSMTPDDPGTVDRFSHVCSPADLEQYPLNAPTSNIRPFFRLTYCDLSFKSVEELERVWEGLKNDVGLLDNNLRGVENPTSSREVVV